MVKKKAAQKSSGGKKRAKVTRTKRTGSRKTVTSKVKKTMTSDSTPQPETPTVLDELLPADGGDSAAMAEPDPEPEQKPESEPKKKKKKKKTKVKFKSVMPREEAISYFEAIVAGLKRGSIQIRQGDEALELQPAPQVDVAVKAASRDQDERIEFELKWRTTAESELTISAE